MIVLLYSSILGYETLFLLPLQSGIGIYGGLYQVSSLTQTFLVFISILSIIILQLSSFYYSHLEHNGDISNKEIKINNYQNQNDLLENKIGKRFYSTNKDIIDPNFISGFVDGDGCFSVSILTINGIRKSIDQRREMSTSAISTSTILTSKIKLDNQVNNYINWNILNSNEYPLVILFILIGAMCLMSSSDLISMFLSIELQSYGLYILATMFKDSEYATSAGLTYFLLGGLSSCFILLGSSLLYVNTGLTNLDGIYILYNLMDTSLLNNYSTNMNLIEENIYNTQKINSPIQSLNISLVILSVGYLFKVSAAPFHFWSPDVYDCLPTIVTCFVAIITKISIFIFILDIVHYVDGLKYEFTWTDILLISSLLSLIVGTVVGLVQSRIKRLFAYSTISHVGFILLALAINSIESIQAFIFYIIQYSLSNLNFFFLLVSLGYFLSYNNEKKIKLSDEKYSPLQLIPQLKGFFFKNQILSLCLAITLFSFAGIPPLIGFFGKQMVLSAALEKGYIFMALIAIITSVISASYYLGVIKVVFFDNPSSKPNEKSNISYVDNYLNKKYNIYLSTSLCLTISILTLILILFITKSNELLSIANILALIIFNP